MKTLRRLDTIPPGLLEAEPQELAALLGGPALLHLKGDLARADRPAQALFVSVLLHGNETSGWYAVRQLLRDFPARPRDLLVFIGNVEAAATGVRTLPGQQDFNRMWRDPEGVARDVLRHADRMPLLAVVDLHNNTGKNPHYAVLTDFSPGSLGLAARFGDTAVYIEEPATVLTRAFSPHTPNVALELGPVSDSGATSRGYNFLRGLLPLHRIPEAAQESVRLYRTLARVHLRQGARFAFASDVEDGSSSGAYGEKSGADNAGARSSQQNGLDLVLDDAIEASNFARLPPGTVFGTAANDLGLQVLDNRHREVTERFFDVRGGRITLTAAVVPAMYTTNRNVVRQDCLCYFMEPLDLNDHC